MDDEGYRFVIPDPPRTQAEQNALYAQGRTKPGKIVTWTKHSKHLIQPDGFAYAFDFAPKPVNYDNIQAFEDMGRAFEDCAKRLGIKILWGGRGLGKSKQIDRPHIQFVE